jgi:SET domain/Rubisco LSMT substrate-binding
VIKQIRAAGIELSSHHSEIAAWLVTELRRPDSTWHPYLAMMPADFDELPLFASAADRALLAGSLTGRLVDELERSLEADFVALTSQVRLLRTLDRGQWRWARACVSSRAFGLTIDDIATTALVPFGDLLNHDMAPNTSWTFDPDHDAFTITATRAIAAGSEIRDSYGSKSNPRLLLQYGFVIDDNPEDTVELRVPELFVVGRDRASLTATAMLSLVQQRHRDDDDLVHATIVNAVTTALAQYPTTLADDDRLLARSDLSATARRFIRARRSEQQVLTTWLARSPAPLR